MTEQIVKVRELSRRFGHNVALDEVSLEVPAGIVFGLVGENGAGKTTLLKHLLGLFKAQRGAVRVFGLDPVVSPAEVLGEIGYLSEERDLPEWMTVAELMSYSAAFYPKWDPAFGEELREMFELSAGSRIRSLSRGQRARAGLLMALAHRPRLLLLDEPSSGLDPIVRRDILAAIIRTVAVEGRTVIFSSHLLDEVERVADQVAYLRDGHLDVCEELPELLQRHRVLTVRFKQELAAPPACTGVLNWQGEGRDWLALCNGQLATAVRELESTAGVIVEDRGASLEEIFLALGATERMQRKAAGTGSTGHVA